ncbi:MAG: hypothetical protein ACI9TB_000887 [Parasphingorhabdus sp.]|jgi:hypothetical protein
MDAQSSGSSPEHIRSDEDDWKTVSGQDLESAPRALSNHASRPIAVLRSRRRRTATPAQDERSAEKPLIFRGGVGVVAMRKHRSRQRKAVEWRW